MAAAVEGGATTVAEIGKATGLPTTTIRPLLSRLLKAGRISNPERGKYVAVAP
ncbi:hypothetical protein ACLBXM_13760 [Xanthobacteraceae bacterium A53D]